MNEIKNRVFGRDEELCFQFLRFYAFLEYNYAQSIILCLYLLGIKL